MKRSNRLHDEELEFIDSINKMSNQVHFMDQKNTSLRESQILLDSLDDLLQELKTVKRKRLLKSVPDKPKAIH